MDRQEQVLAVEAKIAATNAPVSEPDVTPDPITPEAPEPEVAQIAVPVEHDEEENEEAAASDNGVDSTAPRKNKGVGKRINELTREKHEERRARESAEAEVAYWRQQAQHQAPQYQPAQAQTQGKPTLEQYGNDWDAYQEARDSWVIGQAQQSFSEQQRQADDQRQQQARQSKFQERIADFEKEVPGGWEQAIASPVATTPTMLEAIAESDIGPKLGYYLSQNLDESLRISRLSPTSQAVAMGRIEAKLLQPSTPPPPRPVTRAPAPPPSIPNASGVNARLSGIEDHIALVKAQRQAKYG